LTTSPDTCHIRDVTLFNFAIQRGSPIIEQVVFASIRAVLRGEYSPGQAFPSVRAVATSLKIHPNTAHKAIQALIENGWLETRSGIGTVVASRSGTRSGDWRRLLREDADRLIINARSNEVALADVIDELSMRWRQFIAS